MGSSAIFLTVEESYIAIPKMIKKIYKWLKQTKNMDKSRIGLAYYNKVQSLFRSLGMISEGPSWKIYIIL